VHYTKAYEEVEVQLHAFLISSLNEVSDHFHAPIALIPGKEPSVPTEYEAGWAPESI